METIKSICSILVFLLVVIGGPLLVAVGLVYAIDRTQCINSYSEYSPEWGFWEGCRIPFEGRLTPVDVIRVLDK